MYLNIINNISYESKRKSKKIDYSDDKEKNILENETSSTSDDNISFLYYSVFYGDLTKNWINLNN